MVGFQKKDADAIIFSHHNGFGHPGRVHGRPADCTSGVGREDETFPARLCSETGLVASQLDHAARAW